MEAVIDFAEPNQPSAYNRSNEAHSQSKRENQEYLRLHGVALQ
jgi:hypothetical protein